MYWLQDSSYCAKWQRCLRRQRGEQDLRGARQIPTYCKAAKRRKSRSSSLCEKSIRASSISMPLFHRGNRFCYSSRARCFFFARGGGGEAKNEISPSRIIMYKVRMCHTTWGENFIPSSSPHICKSGQSSCCALLLVEWVGRFFFKILFVPLFWMGWLCVCPKVGEFL